MFSDFQEFTTDSSEKKQKIDTSLNKNGICPVFNKKSDVLRNGINENKANKSKLNASNSIISLNLDSWLSKNNYFKKKNALNVCNLKRQEFMKSQSDLNNYYGKFINKKIDDFKKQKMDQNLLVQSDFLTHKQKKQRFFEGEDARMNFVDNYRRDQSSSALRDNQADVNVWTLELNSVPDNISVDELKRMLRIPHLVSLKLDSNLLNNVTTGKGKLTFRTNTWNEKDLIIKKLNQIGISSNDFEDVNYLRTPIVKKSQLKQSEEIEKSDCNNQNGNEANQDQNSIDFMHNSQLPFKNNLVTGKVGEDHITPSKQSNFKYFNVNDSKIKRINFCQSKGELFGNTNSSYAKMHMDKLKRDRSVFDKTTKDQKTHNKIASGMNSKNYINNICINLVINMITKKAYF